MLKWLKLAGNIILGLVILWGVYKIYHRFNGRSKLQSKITTYFLSAEETEALYTGFSFVALLEFYGKDGKAITDLPRVYIDENKRIKGICYRLYEVGIGYPNIGAAIRPDSIPEPEILSVNVADSRVIGDGRVQYQCDEIDTAPPTRAQKLKAQMEADRQWPAQVKHAREILVLLKAQLPDSQALQIRGIAAREVGAGASYLGNLKLTFATVGTFTATKRFLFLFNLNAGFYVRKDITEATYGSQLADLQIDAPLFSFTSARATITFEDPDLIAVNRYIDLLVASSKFLQDEKAQKTIDTYMREDMETQLKNIHGRAVEHSKRLTQLFVRKYGLQEEFQVDLKFSPKRLSSATISKADSSNEITGRVP